jgi:hypothetical protein
MASKRDIRMLAWEWEMLLEKVTEPTPKFACDLLDSLCKVYLRGKKKPNIVRKKIAWLGENGSVKITGIMGSKEYGLLATAVINDVVTREGRETFYPTLVKLGFTDMLSALNVLYEALEKHPIKPFIKKALEKRYNKAKEE